MNTSGTGACSIERRVLSAAYERYLFARFNLPDFRMVDTRLGRLRRARRALYTQFSLLGNTESQ